MSRRPRKLFAIALVIPGLLFAQSERELMQAEIDRKTDAAFDDLLRNYPRDDEDILSYALTHPRDSHVQQSDGTMRRPKYGDHQLENAEAFLAARYPRPWTLPKVIEWCRTAEDADTRVHLMRVIAASRSPRAALFLAEALDSDSLSQRVAGCYGLYDYFLVLAVIGGAEQHMDACAEWLAKYKGRLQKAAAK